MYSYYFKHPTVKTKWKNITIFKLAKAFTAFRDAIKDLELIPPTPIIQEIMLNFCVKLHGSC